MTVLTVVPSDETVQTDTQKNLALLGLAASGAGATLAFTSQPASAQTANPAITAAEETMTGLGGIVTIGIGVVASVVGCYMAFRVLKKVGVF